MTILVNNAGNHFKKTLETGEVEFRQLMDTHVMGAYSMTKAVASRHVGEGHGSLLFTASMTSFFGLPKVFAYSTAKSAIRAWCDRWRWICRPREFA